MNDLNGMAYYSFKKRGENYEPIRVVGHWIFSLLVLLMICLSSCSQEEAVPVVADFTFKVVDDDYSVPVKVAIINRTVGAESYQWTFVGADRISSSDRNPGTLVYDNPGAYKIRLEATNEDGSKDAKELDFTMDAPVEIGFDYHFQINSFAPATIEINNTTQGATTFLWDFEGGNTETSTAAQPANITFSEPGEYEIKLTVGNGREIHELKKTIAVGAKLSVDFDWEVDFQDDDYQVPVTSTMHNKSIGALTYSWTFIDGQPATSTQENPTVVFDEPGTHTVALTISNGKSTQNLTKTIEVLANTNLLVFNDVSFGINTAHTANATGAYFSAHTREVYDKAGTEVIDGALIDLVFFGLDKDFSFNKFISPNDVDDTTFQTIPNGQHTVIINSQEQCECSASLSTSQFDSLMDDSALQNLVIEETQGGLQHFTNTTIPRIVLFQTADGRKGAVKIKEFVSDGQNSYIVTDIKVQKESR